MPNPLFNPDMSTLMAKLRLSGTRATGDGRQVIDEAVNQVRVSFYDALGAARITALLALPSVDNPTTADQIARSRANSCEVNWCRMHLLRTMPILFTDSLGGSKEAWNDEATAQVPQSAVKDEINRLDIMVKDALESLAGSSEPDSGGAVRSSVVGPAERNTMPGIGIWGYGVTPLGVVC